MDRSEAIYRLRVMVVEADTKEDIQALDLAIEALQEPEIVRCGECKYKNYASDCSNPYGTYDKQVADDDYCSNGEKKQVTGNQKSVETSTEKADKSTMGQPKSKLKNPCDSLLKADSDECKEHKSKLDCISREQAVEAVTNTIREKFSLADWYEQLVETGLEIESLIKELPPVTPTERTGEWVFRTDIPIGGGAESAGYVCSECGTDVNCPYNYCHNCGAKMGGDTE